MSKTHYLRKKKKKTAKLGRTLSKKMFILFLCLVLQQVNSVNREISTQQ